MSFHRLGKNKNSWCEDDMRVEDEEKETPKDRKVDQEDQELWRRLQEESHVEEYGEGRVDNNAKQLGGQFCRGKSV